MQSCGGRLTNCGNHGTAVSPNAEPDPMDNLTPSDLSPAEASDPCSGVLASWAALAVRSPADPVPLLPPIQALLDAGRLAEAAVLLDAAQFRFPDHAPFAIEAACVARRP